MAPRLRRPWALEALRHSTFRWFWAGIFISNIGTWMQSVAQAWLVLRLTNSTFWLGIVGFASQLPVLCLGLLGGVIADHTNRRSTWIVTQSIMMISAFSLSALVFFKIITVKEIVAFAAITGVAVAINAPTYQALVPALVPRSALTNAVLLCSSQAHLSRIIGPTLGSYAMAIVGVACNFFLNGLSFLVPILTVISINYREPPRLVDHGLFRQLRGGMSYLWQDGELRVLLMLVAIGSLLVMPYFVYLPYFARDVLHSNERGLGALMACSGCGASLGAGSLAFLDVLKRRDRIAFGAAVGFFIAILAFTASRSFRLSAVILVFAGFFLVMMGASSTAIVQHLVSDEMRGRVISIYSTAFIGLPPLGSLCAGLLSLRFALPHVIASMAVLALALSSGLFASHKFLRGSR